MKDIEIKLNKPYSRESETAVTLQFSFECKFDSIDEALDFQQKLGSLVMSHRAETK